MAYSPAAAALRRCKGTTKAGDPCRAWALWKDPEQLCSRHSSLAVWRPRKLRVQMPRPKQYARYTLCRCDAYAWPHRPGGGPCRWPDLPQYRSRIPSGTRRGSSQNIWEVIPGAKEAPTAVEWLEAARYGDIDLFAPELADGVPSLVADAPWSEAADGD